MKWTSVILIIDGSNYETMSAVNEDHYALSQPRPMYWEVSVLQKIESGLAGILIALVMTLLFSGRGPRAGAGGASAGLPGGGHCPLPHLLQVSHHHLPHSPLMYPVHSRSRVAREETRKMRGAQLYDSIVVRSDSAGGSDPEAGGRKDRREQGVRMPGEMEPGGTMSKAMSYDVNPIYSL